MKCGEVGQPLAEIKIYQPQADPPRAENLKFKIYLRRDAGPSHLTG